MMYTNIINTIRKNANFVSKFKKEKLTDKQIGNICKELSEYKNLNMIMACEDIIPARNLKTVFSNIIAEFDDQDSKSAKLIKNIVDNERISKSMGILDIAVEQGKTAIVEYYISKWQDTKFTIEHMVNSINNGHEEIAKLIISTKHVDMSDRFKDWWLVYACKRCSLDFIKMLLDQYRDSIDCTSRINLALQTAFRRRDTKLVEFLNTEFKDILQKGE